MMRWCRAPQLLVLLGVGSLFLLARLWTPLLSDRYSVCFFKTWTGYPCPFCGLTHAFVAAMHGQWTQATLYHRLWWLPPLLLISTAIAAMIDLIVGSNLLDRGLERLRRISWWWIVSVLGGVWAIQLLT